MSTKKTSLKIGVIGPKGQCGSCVVDELLSRGHTVVGISRSPPKTWGEPGNYSSIKADIADTDTMVKAFSGDFDAIVCAYGPPLSNMNKVYLSAVESHAKIKTALLASTHQGPFIIIGGAGSIHTKSGKQLVDTPEFCYSAWYIWPDQHLDYMVARTSDHGMRFLSIWIRAFKWARNNVEYPGWFSWLTRPLAWLMLRQAKGMLTSDGIRSLITGSRIALCMYEGVRDKSWSFLSPPWLLRDKGLRTGKYEVMVDTVEDPADHATTTGGIYNEDMAIAIVDEAENNNLSYRHWTCVGPIDVEGHRWWLGEQW